MAMRALVWGSLAAHVFSLSVHEKGLPGALKSVGSFTQHGQSLTLRMPKQNVPNADEYQCALFDFKSDVGLLSYKPLPSSETKVHHMTLHLCDARIRDAMKPGKRGVCPDFNYYFCKIFAGFEHMGSATAHPSTTRWGENMGVNVGPDSPFQVAVLEVHNNAPLQHDDSGFELGLSKGKLQKQIVQDVMDCSPNAGGPLPPGQKAFNVSCSHEWTAGESAEVVMVHFHFHSLGTKLSWWIKHADGSIQTPTAQYRLGVSKTQHLAQPIKLKTGAVIHLQCTYDTTNKTRPTAFGMRASDEMCNLFYTYYSDNGKLVLAAGR